MEESLKDRLLIILQLHCLGRVSEVAQLHWDDFRWVSHPALKCLGVDLERKKTHGESEIYLFVHRTCYQVIAGVVFDSNGFILSLVTLYVAQ